jgi:hypothetical protein
LIDGFAAAAVRALRVWTYLRAMSCQRWFLGEGQKKENAAGGVTCLVLFGGRKG